MREARISLIFRTMRMARRQQGITRETTSTCFAGMLPVSGESLIECGGTLDDSVSGVMLTYGLTAKLQLHCASYNNTSGATNLTPLSLTGADATIQLQSKRLFGNILQSGALFCIVRLPRYLLSQERSHSGN